MTKSKLGFVVIFLFLVLGGVLIWDNTILHKKEAKKDNMQVLTLDYTSCFVLQTDFHNFVDNVNLGDLSKYNLIASIQDKEKLSLDLIDIDFEDFANLYNFHKNYDISTLFIVPFDQVDSKMKALSVNSSYPFDKNTIIDYPLCFLQQKKFKEQSELENFQKKLYDFDGTLYDFDINKLRSIFVGGEIIPARAVDRTWLNQSDNYTLLFDRLRYYIQTSDLALAMLENPISGDPTPCRGCMIFVGDERNALGFKEVGFDALGVGNHIGDGGKSALQRTIEVLDENGIKLAGASVTTDKNPSDAVILNFGDKKVAFLSADDVASYYWYIKEWGSNRYSKKSSSGIVVDEEKIENDIKRAKEEADLVVVMMSWGNEYTNHSNSHQQKMAHKLIDAGADIIIGSHPHWVQEIEMYNDKLIIYSLGNFIFDQTSEGANAHWSRRNGETRQAMTVVLYFYDTKLMNLRLLPHKLCGYEQAGGEYRNKVHNLAWKILDNSITYDIVDKTPEEDGCVWYQPTLLNPNDKFYQDTMNRMLEYSNF